MLTHEPFKSCIVVKRLKSPHKGPATDDDPAAHVSLDHDFHNDKGSDDEASPMFVIRERRHKMTWAMLVPRKGTEISWVAKKRQNAFTSWVMAKKRPDETMNPRLGRRQCGQARTPRAALEERLDATVPLDAQNLSWLWHLQRIPSLSLAKGSSTRLPRQGEEACGIRALISGGLSGCSTCLLKYLFSPGTARQSRPNPRHSGECLKQATCWTCELHHGS